VLKLHQKQEKLVKRKFHKILQLETEGKILAQEDKHKESIELFQNADKVATEFNIKNTPSLRSKRLKEIYNSAVVSNNKKLVTEIIKEGININLITDNTKDQLRAQDFTNKLESLFFVSESAKQKTKENLEDTKLAWTEYKLSLDLLLTVRKELSATESKIALSKKSQEIFEGALETAFHLYELSEDKTYLEEAFKISEKNKALSLLDEINDKSAKSFASIPDSLIDLERNLVTQLNKAKKIFIESDLSTNNRIESSKQIDSLHLQIDKLLYKFERDYPKYR